MQILTGQNFATSGTVEVIGAAPYENDAVSAHVCFVKESQRYPDAFTVRHALRAGSLLFPDWDETYAQSLVDDFAAAAQAAGQASSPGACCRHSAS